MKTKCHTINIETDNYGRVTDVECIDKHGETVAVAETSEQKNYIEIAELYVEHGYRKRSYGKQVVKAVQQIAKKKKKSVVLFAQQIDNVNVRQLVQFYKKLGFVAEDVDLRGVTTVHMEWNYKKRGK